MNDLPKRKKIRLEGYDYSSSGAYFVTLCVVDRHLLLWNNERTNGVYASGSPALSKTGKLIDNEIRKLGTIYENVTVDKYCIMPDHIHMMIFITPDENGRTQFAPTLSRVIKQFKGSITKQAGFSIWQKSFNDRIIRDENSYQEVWKYIDTNPLKYTGRGELCLPAMPGTLNV
jgi:REP element-mobilizing transposase RayT